MVDLCTGEATMELCPLQIDYVTDTSLVYLRKIPQMFFLKFLVDGR